MANPLTVPGRAQQIGWGLQTGGASLVSFTGTPPTNNTPTPTKIGVFGAPGTTVAWANWTKWRQGSMLGPKAEVTHEMEGDGSRAEALTYKKLQYGVGKIMTAARPMEAGMLLAAISGSGSDAVGVLAGSVYPHVITPQTGGGNDFYALQQQIGQGQSPTVAILQDAVCYSLTIQASTSAPVVIFDTDWYSVNTLLEGGTVGTPPTNLVTAPTFEPSGPFYFYSGAWTLPFTNLVGNAVAAVKDLTWKASAELSPGDFQAEGITTLPYVMGALQVQVDQTILWQDGGVAAWIYYGKNSGGLTAATPVHDIAAAAQTAPSGAASFTFKCSSDSTQTLALSMPNVVYEAGDFTPDLSGKPVEQKITGHAMRYNTTGAIVASANYTATVNVGKDPYGPGTGTTGITKLSS